MVPAVEGGVGWTGGGDVQRELVRQAPLRLLTSARAARMATSFFSCEGRLWAAVSEQHQTTRKRAVHRQGTGEGVRERAVR